MYLKIKSFFDFTFAILLLLLSLPLILFAMLAVYLFLGSPIFFVQKRPGLYGRPFNLIKFRTMSLVRDSRGRFLPDVCRLTFLGRVLRSTSIDELPSLINILRGEMSFIGPRPLLMQYLSLYTSEQARRHNVKPGFSGWAQINGRNALSWEEKFSLDVWYVDHQSFFLDLRIFILTVWKVIIREGISAPGEATIVPFKGTAVSE